MRKSIAIIIICLLITINTNIVFASADVLFTGSLNDGDIDQYIINEMQSKHIPGLSASIAWLSTLAPRKVIHTYKTIQPILHSS